MSSIFGLGSIQRVATSIDSASRIHFPHSAPFSPGLHRTIILRVIIWACYAKRSSVSRFVIFPFGHFGCLVNETNLGRDFNGREMLPNVVQLYGKWSAVHLIRLIVIDIQTITHLGNTKSLFKKIVYINAKPICNTEIKNNYWN